MTDPAPATAATCSHGPGCPLPWSLHDWSYEADYATACCEVHKMGKCDAVFTCCDKCPTFFGKPAPLVPVSHECYGDRHDDCVWPRCECGCHRGR